MTIIYTVLDFLLLSWIFWPIILALPFAAYYCVSSAVKEDEGEFFAGILIASIVGILAYKYPAIRGYFDGWRAIATVLGGYLVVGFGLSLYKWFTVLWDFRKRGDLARIVENAKASAVKAHLNGVDQTSKEFTDYVAEKIAESDDTYSSKKNLIAEYDKTTGKYSVYPNWKKHPIGTWWVYWPFFILEIPFDWAKRLVERLFNWLRHFYNGLAQKLSVKV